MAERCPPPPPPPSFSSNRLTELEFLHPLRWRAHNRSHRPRLLSVVIHRRSERRKTDPTTGQPGIAGGTSVRQHRSEAEPTADLWLCVVATSSPVRKQFRDDFPPFAVLIPGRAPASPRDNSPVSSASRRIGKAPRGKRPGSHFVVRIGFNATQQVLGSEDRGHVADLIEAGSKKKVAEFDQPRLRVRPSPVPIPATRGVGDGERSLVALRVPARPTIDSCRCPIA